MSNAVKIQKIHAAREGNNQDFVTLELAQEREKSKTRGNLLNTFLDPTAAITSKVVAFQSMHKDAVEKLGLQEGDDLGAKLGQKLTLVITEVTADDIEGMDERDALSFQMKRNNAEEMSILVKDGRPVFRRIQLDYIGAEDTLVAHDGMVDDGSFEKEDFINADSKLAV